MNINSFMTLNWFGVKQLDQGGDFYFFFVFFLFVQLSKTWPLKPVSLLLAASFFGLTSISNTEYPTYIPLHFLKIYSVLTRVLCWRNQGDFFFTHLKKKKGSIVLDEVHPSSSWRIISEPIAFQFLSKNMFGLMWFSKISQPVLIFLQYIVAQNLCCEDWNKTARCIQTKAVCSRYLRYLPFSLLRANFYERSN